MLLLLLALLDSVAALGRGLLKAAGWLLALCWLASETAFAVAALIAFAAGMLQASGGGRGR